MVDDEAEDRDGEYDFLEDEAGDPDSDHPFIKWAREPRLDPAKDDVLALLEQDSSRVFYGRQIEVMLEKKYFHWISHKALRELTVQGAVLTEIRVTKGGNKLRLYWSKRNRYPKRAAAAVVRRVEEHSNPELTRAIGSHAENLFALAAGQEGFKLYGPSIRTFQGRAWAETEHDLDWIFERDGVGWGVEVKNTWAYIGREEMYIKMKLWKHLGIKPLFIMRWAPKSYVEVIRKSGGFGLLYETQLFPFGHSESVRRLKELSLPVVSANAVPEGVFGRFVKYGHERTKRK